MSGTLAGVAYIWLAQAIAFVLMPRTIPFEMRARALAFWAVSAPIVLIVQNPLITLFTAAAVLLVLAPLQPLKRAAFFLIAIPAVPVFIAAPLPFPGINYLTDVTHYKLAGLIILLPVFFLNRDDKYPSPLSGVGVVVLVYVAYAAVLVTLSYGVTLGMRFLLDEILRVILPYYAILMALRKSEDVEVFFQAFLVATLILALVAIVSALKRWDIYGNAASLMVEIRDGSMRINATAGTHSLAFHLAAGVMVLEFLRYRFAIGWLATNIMRVAFIAGMLTADSRGALGGLVVAYGVYTLIMLRNSALRGMLMFAFVAVAAVGTIWLTQGEVSAYDEFGTFSYRQALLRTSLDYIANYPLFGDRFFMQSGLFDHLIQGQGIIDVTNLYLQVALTFGLIGLALFLCVFLFPALTTAWALLGINRSNSPYKISAAPSSQLPSADETWFRATAVTVSICAGWLFLVATTSDVGLTLHLGVVFAAICNALRRTRPIELPQAAPASHGGHLATPIARA